MHDLLDDVSKVTNIQKKYLSKIFNACTFVISNTWQDAMYSNDTTATIDIGLGKLLLSLEDDNIKYKFIPSKKLEDSIRCVAKGQQNPLEFKLEETLKTRVETMYKDLL